MASAQFNKRLSGLEQKAAPPKYVVCRMESEEGRGLTEEEEAAKLALAWREAGPNGTVVVVRWARRPWDQNVISLKWADSLEEELIEGEIEPAG